jgi:DNA-binding transcriptional LysR family regulator
MRPDRIYEALEQDRADLGLVSYPAATRELRAIDWRLEQMVFVCHPSHPLAKAKIIQPSDLGRTDFISFDRGLHIRRALDRFFREHGVQRRPSSPSASPKGRASRSRASRSSRRVSPRSPR